MTIARMALLAAAALSPLPATAAPQFSLPPARVGETPATRLKALFAATDEAELKRNPLSALARGDLRYADRIGDLFGDQRYADARADTRAELAALATISRDALGPTDRIAYDVFKDDLARTLRMLAPEILALTKVRPLDHFGGWQIYYPDVASGQGGAPFNTLADYQNNLKRNAQFAAQLDVAIGQFREGLATGVVQPRLVVVNMIDQLDQQLAVAVAESPFYGPVKRFPAGIAPADRARLTAAYADQVAKVMQPAYRRLRDFLRSEYLPRAREAVGLLSMKGGPALYRMLIEESTTLPLSADEVHQLGLSEVARITREMETVKTQVGFKGTLAQFFAFMNSDKRFQPPSREWIEHRYRAIEATINARIPAQFATVPRTPLEIRAVPPYREKTDAAGSYQDGTPDGSRPGVFYYNAYDLPIRFTWGMETLFLHEGIPGHHFQVSLAQENMALPAFMRFGGNTAFVEGWALYAETLWKALGVESDPHQRFGGLNDEMLRAMRLVVDSGLHAKGWSRDRAIAYMMANSSMSRTDATAEVERYIAIPGQALAYKVGQLTILRLKAEAQAALGTRFDPRAFHAQVLDTGALPMRVLEAKIRSWIAAQKRRNG